MRSLRVLSVFVVVFAAVLGVAASAFAYVAYLSGGHKSPPVNTLAHGKVAFELSSDGQVLQYSIVVDNITDATIAHIRLSTNGGEGPVVASLYGGSNTEEPSKGLRKTGVITATDLTGPLKGQPISALLNSMRRGTAYINVSTKANPPGEIGGWVR